MASAPSLLSHQWCVIGYPLSHSLSPRLHRFFLDSMADQGLKGSYVAFEIPPKGLEAWLVHAHALGMSGFNVTIPHKLAVFEACDQTDPVAQWLGAVNTVAVDPLTGRLSGTNTDVAGFLSPLSPQQRAALKGGHGLILGSGGAARAVALGLLQQQPRQLTLLVRNLETASETFDLLDTLNDELTGGVTQLNLFESASVLPDSLTDATMVVNATPAGMASKAPEALPIPEALLSQTSVDCLFYDLVYNPLETPFLRWAQAHQRPTQDGLAMLVGQGAAAFEFWTGVAVPADIQLAAKAHLFQVLSVPA